MTDWLGNTWYEFSSWICKGAFLLGWRARRDGMHHIPMQGPTLFLANHQSFLDPVAIGMASPRPMAYLARKTLFRNRFLSALMRSYNAMPIDQDGFARDGLRAVIGKLSAGKAVLVFPEGARTLDGSMQPLQPGIHLILKRARAAVVPVGIAGFYDAWPRWRKYPTLAPLLWPSRQSGIGISFGKAIDSEDLLRLPREEILSTLTERLQERVHRAEQLRVG